MEKIESSAIAKKLIIQNVIKISYNNLLTDGKFKLAKSKIKIM